MVWLGRVRWHLLCFSVEIVSLSYTFFKINIVAVTFSFPISLQFSVNCSYLNP